MANIAKRDKHQFWVQVCLIFSQVTFAGIWAGLFAPVDTNKIDLVRYNIVATIVLIAAGKWLDRK